MQTFSEKKNENLPNYLLSIANVICECGVKNMSNEGILRIDRVQPRTQQVGRPKR